MTLVFVFLSIFLISSGALLVILFNMDPNNSVYFTHISFFVFSLLALFSLATLLVSLIFYILKKPISIKTIGAYIRRSFLFSVMVVGLLVFSSIRVLNFISGITFFIAIILLELFFISRKSEKRI